MNHTNECVTAPQDSAKYRSRSFTWSDNPESFPGGSELKSEGWVARRMPECVRGGTEIVKQPREEKRQ